MEDHIKHVTTKFGDIAYTEQGEGPPALFVHGVFLNSYLWHSVIEQVADVRRCIAIDLLGHGATQTTLGQDLSWNVQADMLAAFCDAVGLDTIDLVGNDSGGGIAQIFATRYSARLRSLTLTNCDVHTNCPPPALRPLIDVSEKGNLGNIGRGMLADLNLARQILGTGYEHPERLSEETVHTYLQPIFGTQEHTQLFERLFDQWFVRMDTSLADIAPELHSLQIPTLIVWGTGDVFFEVEWAYWLRDTIPGTRNVVLLDGARLFFPQERPTELVKPLREHWAQVSSR